MSHVGRATGVVGRAELPPAGPMHVAAGLVPLARPGLALHAPWLASINQPGLIQRLARPQRAKTQQQQQRNQSGGSAYIWGMLLLLLIVLRLVFSCGTDHPAPPPRSIIMLPTSWKMHSRLSRRCKDKRVFVFNIKKNHQNYILNFKKN